MTKNQIFLVLNIVKVRMSNDGPFRVKQPAVDVRRVFGFSDKAWKIK